MANKNKRDEDKQPPLMTKRQLQNAVTNLSSMMQQVHQMSITNTEKLGRAFIEFSDEYKNTKVQHEKDFDSEYMQANFEHIFKDIYYDKETDKYIRVMSYVGEWDLVSQDEEKFIFEKEEESIVIDAPNIQDALTALKKKLVKNVTPTEKTSLEEDSGVTQSAEG
jgi:hypothetical protein